MGIQQSTARPAASAAMPPARTVAPEIHTLLLQPLLPRCTGTAAAWAVVHASPLHFAVHRIGLKAQEATRCRRRHKPRRRHGCNPQVTRSPDAPKQSTFDTKLACCKRPNVPQQATRQQEASTQQQPQQSPPPGFINATANRLAVLQPPQQQQARRFLVTRMPANNHIHLHLSLQHTTCFSPHLAAAAAATSSGAHPTATLQLQLLLDRLHQRQAVRHAMRRKVRSQCCSSSLQLTSANGAAMPSLAPSPPLSLSLLLALLPAPRMLRRAAPPLPSFLPPPSTGLPPSEPSAPLPRPPSLPSLLPPGAPHRLSSSSQSCSRGSSCLYMSA
ncbi:hypothetical protein COO60DRAFT_666665 [Scenedesmus sp. NREL 46B-D3]|nr:hypothetical protein COO60DRAFT_666665 [Scenedesmus sp. NREL 46B-D3]